MRTCPKCGQEYQIGQTFCSNCGASLEGESSLLKYEIKYRPSYSMLVVKLDPGQNITGEAGAMTYMTPNIQAKTRMRERGILGSLGLSLLGGQSFFVNDYTAVGAVGEIGLVSAPIGDIDILEVKPEGGYIIQRAAYVASTLGIDLDIQWQGFTKGIFGTGLFMIRTTGTGNLFINSFGALDHHILESGERLIVDNFHLVAFNDSCQYKVSQFGGLKETLLSGEGLVT
jgi:uncharacterized protein (TIGR00266 family)